MRLKHKICLGKTYDPIFFRVSDLESALSECCAVRDIYNISNGRSLPNNLLRLQVYRKCFNFSQSDHYDNEINPVIDVSYPASFSWN